MSHLGDVSLMADSSAVVPIRGKYGYTKPREEPTKATGPTSTRCSSIINKGLWFWQGPVHTKEFDEEVAAIVLDGFPGMR